MEINLFGSRAPLKGRKQTARQTKQKLGTYVISHGGSGARSC
jgi:hypothetical protein